MAERESPLKRTPFHALHEQAGARLIDFGGWHMPVHYVGTLHEHKTVRKGVGLFDVSHMGEIVAQGPEALAFAQYLLTNDVARCAINQAQYTVMCTPEGGIVDDLIVYRRSDTELLFCVNASNTDKDFAWMREVSAKFDVGLDNRSADYAQLAVQGPKSLDALRALTSTDLSAIPYYWFTEGEIAGVRMLIARTGYTGELGVELFFSPEDAVKVWTAVMEAGKAFGIEPIGLGARDTLRLEMKYALYGNDIDERTSPLEAGLGWVVKLKKGDFIGREALVAQKAAGLRRRLIGFELIDRGVPRHGYRALDLEGEPVGEVTSGAVSPCLGTPIGMAWLPTALSKVGSAFLVEIRNRKRRARVVKTPFYHPQSS